VFLTHHLIAKSIFFFSRRIAHSTGLYQVSSNFESCHLWHRQMCVSLVEITSRVLNGVSDVSNVAGTSNVPTNSNSFGSIPTTFPIVAVIEELEEISSTWFLTGQAVPRGWIVEEYLTKLPSLTYMDIIEAYMALIDRLVGRGAERLLCALSTASFAVNAWMTIVIA